MHKTYWLYIGIEVLWLLVAVIVMLLLIFPLLGNIDAVYLQFLALMIIAVVQMFRYVLFLRQVPYLVSRWVKIPLAISIIFLFFTVLSKTQSYFELMDNHDMGTFLDPQARTLNLSGEQLNGIFAYFKQVFLLFTVSSFVLMAALFLRLVIHVARGLQSVRS